MVFGQLVQAVEHRTFDIPVQALRVDQKSIRIRKNIGNTFSNLLALVGIHPGSRSKFCNLIFQHCLCHVFSM